MAGTAAQASAEEVTELMADDQSVPPTCSPYAGELPARDKIADVYTAGYLQATERHLRFATAAAVDESFRWILTVARSPR